MFLYAFVFLEDRFIILMIYRSYTLANAIKPWLEKMPLKHEVRADYENDRHQKRLS